MDRRKYFTEDLISTFKKIGEDRHLLGEFLVDLLTPKEYWEITLRWQIVKQLHRGVPQRKIAEDLGVSIAKITRGSRVLLNQNGGFNKVLKKLTTDQK